MTELWDTEWFPFTLQVLAGVLATALLGFLWRCLTAPDDPGARARKEDRKAQERGKRYAAKEAKKTWQGELEAAGPGEIVTLPANSFIGRDNSRPLYYSTETRRPIEIGGFTTEQWSDLHAARKKADQRFSERGQQLLDEAQESMSTPTFSSHQHTEENHD